MLNQLRCKGYIINDEENQLLANNLSYIELTHVHEFYEVLDSQILKLLQDQEIKFKKTLKLRQISFELIKESIIEVYK